MLKNRSGQYVFFSLVSAISGNAVVAASGAISGRKSLDGLSGLIVLSGNIIELGGGSYRANLYDFDTNGDQAGYFFSASGCVPVQYQFDMIDGNASGRVYPASGMTFPASGAFANVPVSTLSGVVANSGLNVIADVRRFSGALTAGTPGYVGVDWGQVANQGTTVNLTATTINQINTVADGAIAAASFATNAINDQVVDASVKTKLSGIVPNILSGTTFLASGSITSGVINSGIFVTATATVGSGSVYLASGHFLFGSGQYYLASGQAVSLNSGQSVVVNSGQLSGQVVDLLSGRSFVASGHNAVVPVSTLSGVVANSGLFVTLPKETISGVVANSGLFVTATATINSGTVYLASGHTLFGSGQYYLASGQAVSLNSGQLVNLNSGNQVSVVSGTNVNVFSGSLALQSGVVNVAIPDAILDRASGVENSLTPRGALRLIAAAAAGETSGAGTSTFTINNAVADDKVRISATVNASGNRTAITYDLT